MDHDIIVDDPCPVGLRGIVSALNTPFDHDGRLDLASVRPLIDYIVDSGCVGALVPAVAAEVARLDLRERNALVEAVLDHSTAALGVIVGVSGLDRTERRTFCRIARRRGAVAVLYQPGRELAVEVLADVLLELEQEGPGLVVLQDLDWAGSGMPVGNIVELFEKVEGFKALKVEVVPAGPKFRAVLEATGGQMHVSGGWSAGQIIEALGYGVHAFMPCGMERTYCRIFNLYRSGRKDEARGLFERLLPVIAFANQHISVGIRFKKRLRAADGVFATDVCRPPVPEFNSVQDYESELMIARVQGIEAEIAATRAQL